MIALALGSGLLIDYVFFLAPRAEKRKLLQLRLGQHLCLRLLPTARTEDKPLVICLHFPTSLLGDLIGGTGRTRTNTPASAGERISNPLQYLLCLLFRVAPVVARGVPFGAPGTRTRDTTALAI